MLDHMKRSDGSDRRIRPGAQILKSVRLRDLEPCLVSSCDDAVR